MRIDVSELKGIYHHTLDDNPWTPPGVALIAARKMWPVTRGEKTVVAILDTGVDYTHSDLAENVIGGNSFVPGEKDYSDEHGHGTHVAGIVAANGAILGVAPETKILAVKVLNRFGMGSYGSINNGLEWARKWEGENGEKVNVINMSLGGPLSNIELHKQVIKAVDAGIAVVCAAGNSGDANPDTPEILYPAYYSESIAVGAVDLCTGIADFSNSNDRIDIVAPGVDTYSTYPENRYVKLSGTPMAAPHISGAIALIYSRYMLRFGLYPTPDAIKQMLHYQSIDLGQIGFDTLYGYGLFSFNIDGGKAIRMQTGKHKYLVNNQDYLLNTAPFLQKEEACAAIVELCNLLGTDAVFIPDDDSEQGIVEIWS